MWVGDSPPPGHLAHLLNPPHSRGHSQSGSISVEPRGATWAGRTLGTGCRCGAESKNRARRFEPPDRSRHVRSVDTFLRYRPQALGRHLLRGKRPRHHRGQRNRYPEAPTTPGRRSHRRDGSAAVQRVGLFTAEPFDNAVAVVVQRQRHRHGNGREQDHLEVVARLGPSTLR